MTQAEPESEREQADRERERERERERRACECVRVQKRCNVGAAFKNCKTLTVAHRFDSISLHNRIVKGAQVELMMAQRRNARDRCSSTLRKTRATCFESYALRSDPA
jgi:hypothetical protein